MFKLMTSTKIATMGVLLAGALGTGATGATISNFEPTTYTAGTDIAGVDGWSKAFTPGTDGRVMPDPVSGYQPPGYPILSGSQSFVHYSAGVYHRGWGSAAAEVSHGATLSWLVRAETANSTSAVYLSNNVAAGATPAGVQLNSTSDTFQLIGATATDSGVSWTPQTTYRLEMELDFTNDQFAAFYTDITNGGPRTSLGTKAFGADLDVALTQANGGVFIERTSGAAWYDDISVTAVPEPTSVVMYGVGSLALTFAGWRRRR